MKTTIQLFLAFLCLSAAGPKAQAVSPPPDGGYANFTTAEGTNALLGLTSGAGNTGIGWSSLLSIVTGSFNTGVGAGTLALNTADSNTATGAAALLLNTTGTENTANGTAALLNNLAGNGNSAFGAFALKNNTSGGNNTAIGESALLNNTTGGGNIAMGGGAGFFLDPGASLNIVIGNDGQAGDAGTIRIGNTNQTRAFIAGIRGVTTGNMDTVPVIIDSAGQLGTMSSSRRYKKEIKPMDKASEAILALKPVTFYYKSDKANTPEFGLIAEEVAKVNPDLVVRDKNGEIYTVRYEALNAMLLNEFLKEHRTVQELKAHSATQDTTIARLATQIEALTAGLQKVSAQLEISKSAPQTVFNDR